MDKYVMKTLVVGGAAVAGGSAGTWAAAKLWATYGYRLGPWGIVAGAVIGGVAGAALSKLLDSDAPAQLEMISDDA